MSRPTLYRWLRRFNAHGPAGLEDRSHRPHTVRVRTWTCDQVEAVRALREQCPRWGKDKLRVLLKREGIVVSASMIGRILTNLKERGLLHEPPRAQKLRRRSSLRPYAKRKPAGWEGQSLCDDTSRAKGEVGYEPEPHEAFAGQEDAYLAQSIYGVNDLEVYHSDLDDAVTNPADNAGSSNPAPLQGVTTSLNQLTTYNPPVAAAVLIHRARGNMSIRFTRDAAPRVRCWRLLVWSLASHWTRRARGRPRERVRDAGASQRIPGKTLRPRPLHLD